MAGRTLALAATERGHSLSRVAVYARHVSPSRQGLTLVHCLAQRKRFLWDRGCVDELFRMEGGVRGH